MATGPDIRPRSGDASPRSELDLLNSERKTGRGLDLRSLAPYYLKFAAGVAKLVYAPDSKSDELNAHVGSTPTSGTKILSGSDPFR